jgi:hypothetical protein
MTRRIDFNYAHAKQIQISLRDWLVSLQFPVEATVAFNCDNHLHRGRRDLGRFHKLCDKKLLGPNFYKMAESERTLFIAFPEHIDTNLHYHLLIKPAKNRISSYLEHAPAIWEKICRSGSLELTTIDSLEAAIKTSRYCCKTSWEDLHYQNFILSGEFMKQRSTSLLPKL